MLIFTDPNCSFCCPPPCLLLCCAALACVPPLQVAAGAQVILTQPPLDWPAFERWMEDARRRGLHTAARLLVGFPCLSSAANCGFWLALCNAGNNAEVSQHPHTWLLCEASC